MKISKKKEKTGRNIWLCFELLVWPKSTFLSNWHANISQFFIRHPVKNLPYFQNLCQNIGKRNANGAPWRFKEKPNRSKQSEFIHLQSWGRFDWETFMLANLVLPVASNQFPVTLKSNFKRFKKHRCLLNQGQEIP